jgi:hypothetical protein
LGPAKLGSGMLSASTWVSLALLALGCLLWREAVAQRMPEPDQTLISRDQWLAEIDEARRRIEEMRRQGLSLAPPPPSEEELAREALQRILEDESLRPGDIVSTDRGLLVFKGRSSGEPSLRDFAPINQGATKP